MLDRDHGPGQLHLVLCEKSLCLFKVVLLLGEGFGCFGFFFPLPFQYSLPKRKHN